MIFGMPVKAPLPDGATVLDAVAVVKYLDEEGEVGWLLTSTYNINVLERLGMLEAAAYTSKVGIHESFQEDGGEDD